MALPDGPIEGVLLDAGGVLLVPDPAALQRALDPFGVQIDAGLFHRAHYEAMREVDRLGFPDWLAIDRMLARFVGIPEERIVDAIPLIEELYLTAPWIPIDGAAEALLRLQGADIPLAVVSNATGTMEQQLADHRICSVHDDSAATVAIVVDSDVVGVEKPDPRIFDFALEALGMSPDRCVYIGDTVHFDVNGARAAGIRPIHVDPYQLCPQQDDHAHVRSVGDLAEELLS